MQLLKRLSFATLLTIAALLAVVSWGEYFWGSSQDSLYTSLPACLLWSICALSMAGYVFLRRRSMSWSGICLHVSFVLILLGALITHLCSVEGTMELSTEAPSVRGITLKDGKVVFLPFSVRLLSCEVKRNPLTTAPTDYLCCVEVTKSNGATQRGLIAMNHVFRHDFWRFCLVEMGEHTAILKVKNDPWGIGITYAGYALLFVSALLLCFDSRSRFRELLRHSPLSKQTAMSLSLPLLMLPLSAMGTTTDKKQTALTEFGKIYVCHNERVQPMQSLARDFCYQVCDSYSPAGYSAIEVLWGFAFCSEEWRRIPLFRVENPSYVRKIGSQGNLASYDDFYDSEGCWLDRVEEEQRSRSWKDLRESLLLAQSVMNHTCLFVVPRRTNDSAVPDWASAAEDSAAVRGLSLAAKAGDADSLLRAIREFKDYQVRTAGTNHLPSSLAFRAELFYNQIAWVREAAMVCVFLGLLFYVFVVRRLARGQCPRAWFMRLQTLLLVLWSAWLLLMLVLRSIVGEYLPFANGFETMIALALALAVVAGVGAKRFFVLPAFALLLGGLALLVASNGDSPAAIMPLQPVLSSSLLSVHVGLIVMAYALLTIVATNGATAALMVLLRARPFSDSPDCPEHQLAVLSRLLLYPAVLMLAAGIFVGAIWGNQSWGNYWSWDPKETWALITLVVYALPLHDASCTFFRSNKNFHLYVLAGFITVLTTYFGVNLFLGGMHSYM